MIYTVTLNPALDYVIQVPDFALGQINRTRKEQILCGGKGINVSAMLAQLGVDSVALGFTAGFTGQAIEAMVSDMGICGDFIRVEGMSRINIKMKSGEETEINGMGPGISEKDQEHLFEKLQQLQKGDVLVLSGSVPASVDPDIYRRMMERVKGRGVRTVVDAQKDLLGQVLPLNPFFVKPNHHELGEFFGKNLSSLEEIRDGARRLQAMGAANVLVSMADQGALLAAEDGRIYMQKAAKGQLVNSVGAGDSMVAGFLAGCLKTGDFAYSLKLGTACGGATAFSQGIGTREKVRAVLEQLN